MDLVALGLFLQAYALGLVFLRLRRRWVNHVGAIFIVMATIYNGTPEILVRLFPGRDPWRPLVQPQYLNQFVLWVSIAIFIFTIVYLVALGKREQPVDPEVVAAEAERTQKFFNWKIMVLACIPLVVFTLQGRGFDANGAIQGTGAGAAAGFSTQYLMLAVVLASLGFIGRYGPKWVLPVLIVESAVLLTVGQRFFVIAGVILTIYGLSRFGIKMRRKQIVVGILFLLAIGLVITSARASQGRFSPTTTGALRFQTLVAGLKHVGSPATRTQLAGDLGYRTDGNSFGAMELQALNTGQKPLGITPLRNDAFLAVPSFINPNKDSSDIGVRVEKTWAEEHLALAQLEISPGVYRDILPTQLGGTLGWFGPWGMLAIAAILGLIFARLDRWLFRGVGPSRMIIGLSLLYCALLYEGSWSTYTVTARGALLLLVVVWVVKTPRYLATRSRPRIPALTAAK